MGRSVPSLATRTVWFARPTTHALADDPGDRVLDRLPGLLVDDAEHAFERLALGLRLGPSRSGPRRSG